MRRRVRRFRAAVDLRGGVIISGDQFSGTIMTKLTYVAFDGTRFDVEAENGSTVMENAIRNAVPGIEAECGGACACATCHVYVDEAWTAIVGEPEAMEEDMLDFAYDVQAEFAAVLPDQGARRARRAGRAAFPSGRAECAPCISRCGSDDLEGTHEHSHQDRRSDHRRRAGRPVRRVRARPVRPEMPSDRHSRPAGRPVRRALSGKADLRHSGLPASSARRNWSTS